MTQGYVTYPDHEKFEGKKVSVPLWDWFNIDADDAVTFGVLKEPEFDAYSDIAIMQTEWLLEELLRESFTNAIVSLGIEIEE